MNNKKARVIAYYLPQYHPIPENDKYWGKGFTEWTNVAKAKPLFRGHVQPNIPADLGFYDLRMPEVREEQAKLAKEAGIEGFCYWHYWFGGGKELLERPFNEVVESGKPDFPFCLGWANHTWATATWSASKQASEKQIIAEMTYPGEEDHKAHFEKYLKAFKDDRYIKVDGKLLFVIFSPKKFVDFAGFKKLWNELAKKEGLNGFYFVGVTQNYGAHSSDGKISNFMDKDLAKKMYQEVLDMGFDAINSRGGDRGQAMADGPFVYYAKRFLMTVLKLPLILRIPYKKIIKNYYTEEDKRGNVYPTIIPNFDRTPRAGRKTNNLWYGSTPALFKEHVQKALECLSDRPDEHKILFLQSWNEWGEGNYMEPDLQWGHAYVDALNEVLSK